MQVFVVGRKAELRYQLHFLALAVDHFLHVITDAVDARFARVGLVPIPRYPDDRRAAEVLPLALTL